MSRTIGDKVAPQASAIPEIRIAYLPPHGGMIHIMIVFVVFRLLLQTKTVLLNIPPFFLFLF